MITKNGDVPIKGGQYKCGPWTQGPFLCQTLRLLEDFDLKGMGNLSADYRVGRHVAVMNPDPTAEK